MPQQHMPASMADMLLILHKRRGGECSKLATCATGTQGLLFSTG